MRISTKSQYGLRAMIYLAKTKDKVCPLKKISQAEGISFDYLEKIISKLKEKKLIKAKKGPKGGYFLAKDPKKIKVGQIIKALEGEMALIKCIAKEKRYFCPREKKCLTKNFWKKIQKSLNYALDSVTLEDLINPEGE